MNLIRQYPLDAYETFPMGDSLGIVIEDKDAQPDIGELVFLGDKPYRCTGEEVHAVDPPFKAGAFRLTPTEEFTGRCREETMSKVLTIYREFMKNVGENRPAAGWLTLAVIIEEKL